MIKEEIMDAIECYNKPSNTYKLETALAWIRCVQKGKSPIDRLREKDIEQVIVYGITELGEFLVREACIKQFKVLAITDRAIQEGGYEYHGIPVLKRKDIAKYKDEAIIVTSMTFWEEIRDELQTEGCKYVIALRELL